MSRNVLLALLLVLATGVVLADDAPEAGHGASATGEQAQTKAQPEATAQAETKTQAETKAQPKTKKEAETKAQSDKEKGPKVISGMSILGNQEAPKSLVIVPWKSSEIGASLGISTILDDSRRPVDREVFMRALGYYQIRKEMAP